MKKLFLMACLIVSPIAFADIQSAENNVDFEQIRHASVENVNLAIRKAGGIQRLTDDSIDGDANSLYVVSRMYQYGIVKKQNFSKSVELLEKAARQNHPEASFSLGVILLGKDPVVGPNSSFIDKGKGISLIMKAAETGIVEAQYMLGLYYIEGDLIPEDRDLGLFWLTKARDKGYEAASKARSDFLNSSKFNLSFDYVQKRATEGSPEFLVKLASFYENGWVVQRDRKKSIRLLKTAAKLGSSQAIDLLRDKGIEY